MKSNSKTRNFIIMLLVPVMLFVILALSMINYQHSMSEKNIEKYYAELENSAQLQADAIDIIVESYVSILEAHAASSVEIYGMGQDALVSYMSDTQEETDFRTIGACNLHGAGVDSSGMQVNVADRNYFKECITGKNIIEKIEESKYSGSSLILLSVPVKSQETIVGMMWGIFAEEEFTEILEATILEEESYAFICDSKGNVIVKSDSKYLLGNNKNIFDGLTDEKMKAGFTVEKIKQDLQNQTSGMLACGQGENERYATYIPMGINDWIIFEALPGAVVEEELRSYIESGYRMATIVILTALLALILMLLANKHSLRLIQKEKEALIINEEALKQINQRHEMMENLSDTVFFEVDHSSGIINFNKAFT